MLIPPQSFFEADLILDRLSAQSDKGTSFHVVVPSLPGYGLSGPPPRQGWTLQDTARVFDTLMTEVLGYKSYAAQGGDWGYAVRAFDWPVERLGAHNDAPTGDALPGQPPRL